MTLSWKCALVGQVDLPTPLVAGSKTTVMTFLTGIPAGWKAYGTISMFVFLILFISPSTNLKVKCLVFGDVEEDTATSSGTF